MTTGFNIFCSGLAHLMDGTLFAAGGNKNSSLHGIKQTHLFNQSSNTWSRGTDMAVDRWYPTVTPLSDGEMLITEGGPDVPEVRQNNGIIRSLTSASLDQPLYPWMDVAPDGRAFYSGPDNRMASLNPSGTGAWQMHGGRDGLDRDYGSHAMYDIGKILVAGGGNSLASARTINLNGASPLVSTYGSMATGRRQHNITVLADGTVLATGGNSSGAGLVDINNGAYTAELWNPATGTWRTLASEQVTRQYHSTALLLPDGRVLSSVAASVEPVTLRAIWRRTPRCSRRPICSRTTGRATQRRDRRSLPRPGRCPTTRPSRSARRLRVPSERSRWSGSGP